jgi:acetoacetate decarboxylase
MTGLREYEFQGRVVRFPVRLLQAADGRACFHVPVHLARRIIPAEFEPANFGYGNTRLELFFLHHKESDLGRYQHAGIVVWVRPAHRPSAEPGYYFALEGVDQTFTWEAGRAIWGYPKIMAEVSIQYFEGTARGRIAVNGRNVFTLTVPRKGRDATSDVPIVTYTLLHDRPHQTVFLRSSEGELINYETKSVDLELGDHPLALELKAMGIPRPPFFVQWSERMWGRWREPEPM